MKVLVCIKRVIDYKTVIRLTADGSGVETANVKMSMNPFDEIALEEAIRLKEQGLASEVIAVTIGAESAQETLRTALAMGADRGVFVKNDQPVSPLLVAKILHTIVLSETPQLVLLGKQAIDSDDNQVGQMLAGLLQWPQGTFASKLVFHDAGVSVTRELDGGLETLFLKLPAVITTDLRLNEPRYISLPNIVKAKQKLIKTLPTESFDFAMTSQMKILQVSMPQKKRAQIRVNNVVELIDRLKNEAQVL
ncbi:MAG TPA: electron transfer flavoprotein subunit beta/FixA family protein [Gammaproteobacteria bacterium]|jgi:electron transfer flavoprotein beta subunit|nr:electron transfer flavoprotein subunit beta/FixA family protein [Gammaproteobacteria bacterium]